VPSANKRSCYLDSVNVSACSKDFVFHNNNHVYQSSKEPSLLLNPITFSKAINPMTFLKVASGNEDEVIDLEFVHSLISNGASVHTTDRHGQSVLHEAARDWDLGIAEFLLDNGE
jgi:ankyrin repeat protein